MEKINVKCEKCDKGRYYIGEAGKSNKSFHRVQCEYCGYKFLADHNKTQYLFAKSEYNSIVPTDIRVIEENGIWDEGYKVKRSELDKVTQDMKLIAMLGVEGKVFHYYIDQDEDIYKFIREHNGNTFDVCNYQPYEGKGELISDHFADLIEA